MPMRWQRFGLQVPFHDAMVIQRPYARVMVVLIEPIFLSSSGTSGALRRIHVRRGSQSTAFLPASSVNSATPEETTIEFGNLSPF